MVVEIKKTAVYSVSDDMVITVKVGEGKIGSSTVMFKPPDPDAFTKTLAIGKIKNKSIGKGSGYRGGKLIIETMISSLLPSNNLVSVDYEITGGSWNTVRPYFREEDIVGSTVVTILEVDLL
ncbi:MAG: hypothetical protein KAW14_03175 [Candidatus Aegiribacteria sp.]|nr:hypothetical protein [Candidatus Aegiribacteria sp.]